MTSDVLRSQVAGLSASGYEVALTHIEIAIAKLTDGPTVDSPKVMEARLVRAEVLQKMGKLRQSEDELRQVVPSQLSVTSSHGYLLIRAKLAMQQGRIKDSSIALAALEDKLGPDNLTEIGKTHLWRKAYVAGVLEGATKSRPLSEYHRDCIAGDGFQEANNIIYTDVLPSLSGDHLPYLWQGLISRVRQAGNLYLNSVVPVVGRIHNRPKSLAQALLTEALVWWKVSNRYTAFKLIFVAARVLRHNQLGADCEGIGEVLLVLRLHAKPLARSFCLSLTSEDGTVIRKLASTADSHAALPAFNEAREVVLFLLANDILSTVYVELSDGS